MLSTAELRAELDRIGYCLGWEFSAYDDPFEGQKLRIVGPVRDSRNLWRSIDLGVDSFVPPMETAEQFHRFVLWRLLRIASHEVREFFRVDGIVVWDPHDGEG